MELYHALNRGVDGKTLFHNEADHARFVHCLYEFNDTKPAENILRRTQSQMFDLRSRTSAPRERLVDIHGWCLVRNHYHLLLSERIEGGIRLFLRKLNIGFAKYYNEKYQRTGTLLQGRTKKILIKNDAHFLFILHYIHLNALDLLDSAKEWRIRDKGGIKNMREALEHLEKYRWSSYQDYIGKKNFPSIVTTRFFDEAYGNYGRAVRAYLKDSESPRSSSLVLE